MQLGIIGTGTVALTIAKKMLAGGHRVALASRRGPEALTDVVAPLGDGGSAVSIPEAAAADIVILAVPWSEAERALTGLPAWNNRILVDTTNPFVKGAAGPALADLGGGSSSAIVAKHAPGARVVKAFNSILMSNLEQSPSAGGGRRVLFVSGDDAAAKDEVSRLVEGLGYAAVDLGNLEDGGRMQQGGGPLAGKDLVMLADWHLAG